ncbi:MAG TPA: hypothetical protein VLE03_04825 [Nitrospiraceae bacterium]|nr:hypothetical protein [Nitrospiraceae bacterium]
MLVPFPALLYNPGMKSAVILALMSLLNGWSIAAAVQTQGRTSTGPVGASMAMLATLQDADVLPPEGTAEANRVIQIVIQFQAVFMKSSDPIVQQFFDQALGQKWGDRAQELGRGFRARGWTSEVLQAISERYATLSAQERAQLAEAFFQFNMRLADFELLSDLFEQAQARLSQRGQDIHQIFTEHRRTMPGGQRNDRKERRNGNEGVYSHQS